MTSWCTCQSMRRHRGQNYDKKHPTRYKAICQMFICVELDKLIWLNPHLVLLQNGLVFTIFKIQMADFPQPITWVTFRHSVWVRKGGWGEWVGCGMIQKLITLGRGQKQITHRKRQAIDWEKTFANHMFNEVLVYKICKKKKKHKKTTPKTQQ